MANNWIDEDTLSKIDPSDVKVFLIGLVFLLIPIFFFIFYIRFQGPRSFSQESVQTQLLMRSSVFNFSPSASIQDANLSKSSSKGSPLRSSNSLFLPPQIINRDLEEAMKRMEQSASRKISIPGLSEEKQLSIEADMNHDYRTGCAYLEYGNLAKAEESFLKALEAAEKNPFLQTYALGGLMEVYLNQGKKKEFQEIFSRYLNSVSNLPAGIGGNLPMVMKNTAELLKQMKDLDLSKVSPEVSNPGNLDKKALSEVSNQNLEILPIDNLSKN
ncbi:MAG: hypothetical protein HQM08_27485 [Candidatus Riflebacteria bacterium]|nr:hypothetical protein [Candidatus Riflebacteria bacterium]